MRIHLILLCSFFLLAACNDSKKEEESTTREVSQKESAGQSKTPDKPQPAVSKKKYENLDHSTKKRNHTL
ncbi:MAG: hypothetical protein KJP01_00510, partial [Gramella sp.]|nr:hypothetical protein [Christiangramia sp.]